MKPELQRIAIAKACGWGEPYAEGVAYRPLTNAPDYLNDVNAMRSAERILTDDQQLEYVRTILDCPREHLWNLSWDSVFHAMHASASARAEAFLRTLNLWKD